MKQSEDLKFPKNGKFKIICFGDLHERMTYDDRNSRLRYEDMILFHETAIKALQPDFAVYLGDTLTKRDESEGHALYRAALKNIFRPVLDANIPFGYVMGNHEHDTQQERLIVEAYDQFETCYCYNDEPSVTGDLNCAVPVKSSDGTRDAFVLWFIDSNNLCPDKEVSKYDWVHKDQIDWYEKKAAEYKEKNGQTVPSVVFQHIPVTEEYDLLREAKISERLTAVRGDYKWGDKFYVAKGEMDGYLGEGPCAPYHNDGQFESWKKTGDVRGAFFGHDHMNDFTGNLDGILLGQNKTGGFRAYTDGCRSCVRMITLDQDSGTITTKVYHFKEFGLESRSLGPIMKRINDRQSILMHKASYAAAAAAGIAAFGYVAKKLLTKK